MQVQGQLIYEKTNCQKYMIGEASTILGKAIKPHISDFLARNLQRRVFVTGKSEIFEKAAFSSIFDACPAYMFASLPFCVLFLYVFIIQPLFCIGFYYFPIDVL